MTTTPAIARPFVFWVDKGSKTQVDGKALSTQPFGMISTDLRLTEGQEPSARASWLLPTGAADQKFTALQDAITAARIVARKPLADPNNVDYKTGEVYLSDADNAARSWLISSPEKPARGKVKQVVALAADLNSYVRSAGMPVPTA